MSRTIVCRCEDVTAQDVEKALALGHRHLEEVKRYTGFGTGPCEGKECQSIVARMIQRLGGRKAEMQNMKADGKGRTRLEYIIPARGLIGFRGQFLTDTRGTGIMHHNFESYQPYKGEISTVQNGVLVAMETGVAASY